MTKNYKYRPPIFCIFLGLGALYVSYTLLRTIRLAEFGKNGFQVLVGFFGMVFLVLGIFFIKKLIDNLSFSDLKIGDDSILIPGRLNKKVLISFTDIVKIENSLDKVIEISSKSGTYAIDGTRMSVKDFQELKNILTGIKFGDNVPSR